MSNAPSLKNSLQDWLVLGFLVITWGSSFILMKKGLLYMPYNELGLLRLSITGLFLLPLAIWMLRKLKARIMGIIFISGLLGHGVPALLFARAQTGIDSNLAGILNSLTPFFTLIVGTLFFSVKTRWINVVGVFVGLGGAVGLLSVSGGHSLQFNISFGVYVLLATLMYAVNINLIKKHLSEISTLAITSLAFVFVGLPALILLIFTSSFTDHLRAVPEIWTGIAYVALLAVVGSGIAVLLYNRLIQRRSVLFAASVTYMMPIVAVLWGIIDGEVFRPSFLIWIGIILCGVFLVNKRKKAV